MRFDEDRDSETEISGCCGLALVIAAAFMVWGFIEFVRLVWP